MILADPPGTLRSTTIEPAACKQVIALMRALHEYSIVDLGHGALDSASQFAIRMADTIVVVFRLDVPSLRLTRVYLKKLAEIGVAEDRIFLVANRYGQRRQLPWKKAEESLGLPVRIWLPDDPATLNTALNHGAPLVEIAGRARITRRFEQMAKGIGVPAQ